MERKEIEYKIGLDLALGCVEALSELLNLRFLGRQCGYLHGGYTKHGR